MSRVTAEHKRTAECLVYAHVDSAGRLRRAPNGVPYLYGSKRTAERAKPHVEDEPAYLAIVVDVRGWRP